MSAITPEARAFLVRHGRWSLRHELKEAGYDPEWFGDCSDAGPYVACKVFGERCPCCGAPAAGWVVVDISTITAGSETFFGDNGQCDAEELAAMLNAAWVAGTQSTRTDATA